MKKSKLTIEFINLYDTATDEQKKEYDQRIKRAYEIVIEEVFKRKELKLKM